MKAITRNIARRNFLTTTSDSLLRETLKGFGDCITMVMGGQDDFAVLEVRSANEKVQRLAIEAGKFLEFDDIYSPFPAFTFGDE
jgi:protein-arginine kinase